jgi:hypothetical protein
VRAEKEQHMAFEDKEAELHLTRMQNEPQDLHELSQEIRLKLNEMKAFGMPLPADLVQFEHNLEVAFAAEHDDEKRSTPRQGHCGPRKAVMIFRCACDAERLHISPVGRSGRDREETAALIER